jgi:hypothetical protein
MQTDKLDDCQPKDILSILTKGLLLLGIRYTNLPSDFEMTYMVTMLQKDYRTLPIGELNLAFELCAKDKLDDVSETYQNFSVLYLSRMMSAYARYVRKLDIPQEEVKQIKAAEPTEDDIINMSYDHYKRTQDWEHVFMGLRVFKILHNRKLISTIPEDIDAVVNMINSIYKRKIEYSRTREERDKYKEEYKDEDTMELQCRRMSVALYFDKLMKEEK